MHMHQMLYIKAWRDAYMYDTNKLRQRYIIVQSEQEKIW